MRQVTVTGAKPKVAKQVAAAARQLVAGRSLLAVDPGLLARQLAALPTVRSVTVLRRFPHGLRIRVTAEVPVAVVSTGSGRFVLAASGRVLGPVDRTSASLPELGQVAGAVPRPGGTATGAGLADQLAVAAALHGTRISAIGISADGIAAIAGKTTLRLGDVSDLGRKLRLARAVLRASRSGGAQPPSYVDVSVPDHPAARSVGGDPTTGGSAIGTPAPPPPQGPSTSTQPSPTCSSPGSDDDATWRSLRSSLTVRRMRLPSRSRILLNRTASPLAHSGVGSPNVGEPFLSLDSNPRVER